MPHLPCQRHLFDIPDDVAYFNCAYNGPLLKSAAEALVAGSQAKCRPWQRKPADFFEDPERFRTLAAQCFGGAADNYAVIPSTSYGISTAARILEAEVGAGDEILVLEEIFPSNYLPWHRLTQVTGATLATVPTPVDQDWTEAVLSSFGARTRIVAVPNCHWTNGAMLDLGRISDAARSAGAVLVLDVTQSLGASPLDLDQIRPDFLVASGYKWLLMPYGLSLFYADPKWHDARPLEETWLNRAGAEVFENLVDYAHDYQPGARRFDMGEKSIPTLLPGGLVALEHLRDWGVAGIASTLESVNDRIAEVLVRIGLEPVEKPFRAPHILGASAKDGLPEGLLPRLAERNIFISRRGNSLRFAPHLHVNENDLDKLFDTLEAGL
ncbi:aminotransferase class V-fold PLP-dependent enzyme [uncultured Roseibium sp.]|uniref:aminotransferase class V-fold PLP-dependent enzyme n=1 Tax=uncultured Roseibium sp. TaxID=1936171 RepID=UPI003216F741